MSWGERAGRWFRRRCPRCDTGRLKMRNWLRATSVDDTGKRFPDSWAYFECDRCAARLKVYFGGKIDDVGDEEWEQHPSTQQ